jgi:hypothetical protein
VSRRRAKRSAKNHLAQANGLTAGHIIGSTWKGYQELEPKPRMQEVEAGLSDFILDELATLEPHHYPYMKYREGFRGRQGFIWPV